MKKLNTSLIIIILLISIIFINGCSSKREPLGPVITLSFKELDDSYEIKINDAIPQDEKELYLDNFRIILKWNETILGDASITIQNTKLIMSNGIPHYFLPQNNDLSNEVSSYYFLKDHSVFVFVDQDNNSLLTLNDRIVIFKDNNDDNIIDVLKPFRLELSYKNKIMISGHIPYKPDEFPCIVPVVIVSKDVSPAYYILNFTSVSPGDEGSLDIDQLWISINSDEKWIIDSPEIAGHGYISILHDNISYRFFPTNFENLPDQPSYQYLLNHSIVMIVDRDNNSLLNPNDAIVVIKDFNHDHNNDLQELVKLDIKYKGRTIIQTIFL